MVITTSDATEAAEVVVDWNADNYARIRPYDDHERALTPWGGSGTNNPIGIYSLTDNNTRAELLRYIPPTFLI